MGQQIRNVQLDRQLAELQANAVEVFGDHDAALRWLDTGLSELDDLEVIRNLLSIPDRTKRRIGFNTGR